MRRQQKSPEELIAAFKARAAAPPNRQNELLVRHLRCKESLELSDAVTSALARYHARQRAGAASAHGNPATAPVETLAPAFAQALPSLDGQPVNYSHEVNGEMLFELCAALVRMGLGTPELWSECGEDPLAFAQRSIVNRIGKETIELLERNVEYHLEVTDVVGADSAGSEHGTAGDNHPLQRLWLSEDRPGVAGSRSRRKKVSARPSTGRSFGRFIA